MKLRNPEHFSRLTADTIRNQPVTTHIEVGDGDYSPPPLTDPAVHVSSSRLAVPTVSGSPGDRGGSRSGNGLVPPLGIRKKQPT